jgi:hypothetical protein
MTATPAVRLNISLLRIAFSLMKFWIVCFQLLGIAAGSVDNRRIWYRDSACAGEQAGSA